MKYKNTQNKLPDCYLKCYFNVFKQFKLQGTAPSLILKIPQI